LSLQSGPSADEPLLSALQLIGFYGLTFLEPARGLEPRTCWLRIRFFLFP